MLREATEIVRAVLEFLRDLKVVCAIFLGSLIWLLPPVRNLLLVPKAFAESANFAVSIVLVLTFAYLLVSAIVGLYQRVQKWKRSPERFLRWTLARASPIEKLVLDVAIRKGEYLVRLDVGSPIAMHLQELGLIKRATGLPYTTYQLATGLSNLCIREPSLLGISEQQQEAAVAEMEQWEKEGLHKSFFNQLAGPSNTSWMA
jgi:hypothetical protein